MGRVIVDDTGRIKRAVNYLKQTHRGIIAAQDKVRRRDLIEVDMEEEETVRTLHRKELRKQKLMRYLAAKGKLNLPNPKPHLHDECQDKKPVLCAPKVKGKENTVPDARFRHGHTKAQTTAAQSTKHPARTAFGVTNKENIKGCKVTPQPSSSGPAEPKLKPALSNTYSVIPPRSDRTAASRLKKQSNTGMQSSSRASSIAAATKLNSRSNICSDAATSRLVKTDSVRMSLCPIVKTKTGLIPAVIQPRSSHITPSAAASGTAANKVRSCTSSSVSVSHRSVLAQRKPLHATTLNKPVSDRTDALTTKAWIKAQDQNKTKATLGKHSQQPLKSHSSNGLKPMSTFPKSTVAAVVRPERRVGLSKTNISARQPTDTSTKQRSGAEGKGGQSQPSKVGSKTSLGTANRCSSRSVSTMMHAELGQKTNTCEEMAGKMGRSSGNALPTKTGSKRVVTSQTVPRPVRNVSRSGQETDMKTPKIPIRVISQTEGKKCTAAQQERLAKLKEWRENKGISYKRPPMQIKPPVKRAVAVPQPFWATMKEEDEAHSLISAVDRSLADCIKLLGEGCPPEKVKEVLSRLPAVSQKFAKYWICQARLMEQEGNLDVLSMFEQAVGVVLEPVDELRTVVFEILKKKEEFQASKENEVEEKSAAWRENSPESIDSPMMTPKPVRALICGEKGASSVVKYKITATPGGPQSQQREPTQVNGQEVRFFTPVRRSVRIERASLRYPTSLQDHDLCVASYSDLVSEEHNERSEELEDGEGSPSAGNTPMYIYRENDALKDKVFVQLLCDESV